jgi:hypothetical protein
MELKRRNDRLDLMTAALSADHPATPMKASGFAFLLGLFAGLCSVFAGVATLADWYSEATERSWPVVSAVVDQAEVDASPREAGSRTIWTLRYRVHYVLDGTPHAAALISRAAFSWADAETLQAWADQHGKGSEIDIRYDPSRDGRAAFASDEVSVNRACGDFTLFAMFAAASLGLLALAKFLRRREISAPAASVVSVGDGVVGGRLAIGLATLALGLLISGASIDRTIDADPFKAENLMGVPFGLVFVFAGIMVSLPQGPGKWRDLLAALLVTCMALIFDWVAFGPGERQFTGSVNGFGYVPSELSGRVAFGIAAIIFDIFAILMWVQQCRRALGWSTSTAPFDAPPPSD